MCSFLSKSLLSNHWNNELENLIVGSETGFTPEGDAYKILQQNKNCLPSAAAPLHISRLLNTPTSRHRAYLWVYKTPGGRE